MLEAVMIVFAMTASWDHIFPCAWQTRSYAECKTCAWDYCLYEAHKQPGCVPPGPGDRNPCCQMQYDSCRAQFPWSAP